MRAAKVLAVLAIAALGIGSFSAVALAVKKKKTAVIFFNKSPGFSGFHEGHGKVTAKGSLNTVSACEPNRSMRLQVLDANGVVLSTLDGSTSDSSGNWSLAGRGEVPTGTNSVRVKAKKRTVGKFGHAREPMRKSDIVCQAGFSPTVAIPAV